MISFDKQLQAESLERAIATGKNTATYYTISTCIQTAKTSVDFLKKLFLL